MNLSQFETALQMRLAIPANDAMFDTTTLDSLINAANHMLETTADWPWLEKQVALALTIGTDSYAAPADWMRTAGLTLTDLDRVLEPASIRDLDALLGVSGPPRIYGFYADQLIVRPKPAAAYTVTHYYIRSEPDMVAGTDSPLSPVSYHQAIVELSAYLGFRRANNQNEASVAWAAWQDWRARMLARANRVALDEGGGVEPPPEPVVVGRKKG